MQAAIAHRYHPSVDGLRAISILSVVLYHAGIAYVPGGFVGVDIFFVISGFLIINQIVEEVSTNRFSYASFWAKRALRILPPYLLVITTTVIVGPWVLALPDEYYELAKEAAFSALMSVNHLFLAQQGYFDQSSDAKVLLHLWSLAVEEQFYLLAPPTIVGLWLLAPKLRVASVALTFVASLFACIFFTGRPSDTNYAFYLMPLRAWEFIAGGAVGAAIPYIVRLPRLLMQILGLVGLGLVAYSVTQFSRDLPFPSYWAAIPVAGASLLIAVGLASPSTLVPWLLSTRIMVGIGLVSYSWYLWHWPLLAYARIYNFGDFSQPVALFMVALSLVLAIVTYLTIERPIRIWRRKLRLSWKTVTAGMSACVVAFFVSLALDWRATQVASSIPPSLIPVQVAEDPECQLFRMRAPSRCKGSPSGMLLGDSQADAAAYAIQAEVKNRGGALYTFTSAGCLPVFTAKVLMPFDANEIRCEQGKLRVGALLRAKRIQPEFAILYARWPIYGISRAGYTIGRENQPEPDQGAAFVDSMRSTALFLNKNGVKKIMVIGPTPDFPRSSPHCLVRSDYYSVSRDERCSFDRKTFERKSADKVERLYQALGDLAFVEFVDPLDAFCDWQVCRPYAGDDALFTDTNHLSAAGAAKVIALMPEKLDWLMSNGDTALERSEHIHTVQ